MHYPKNSEWMRRRWLDFRNGNSNYLRFGLAFSNTIIIAYFFLIERVYFFEEMSLDIWIFGLIFLASYILLSIIVGAWHFKTQVRTDVATNWEQRPLMAKTMRLLIRIANNEVNQRELLQMRDFFERIERKQID